MTSEHAKILLGFFLPQLRNEFRITKIFLAAIPEHKREYAPDSRSRSALDLAWHTASTEIWFLDGIIHGQFGSEQERMPGHMKSVADIIEWYEKNVPAMLDELEAMPADRLTCEVAFYGLYNYPAVTYLSLLMVHTAHHRGQLTAYLRPMGATVPSIYGGSADQPFQAAARP